MLLNKNNSWKFQPILITHSLVINRNKLKVQPFLITAACEKHGFGGRMHALQRKTPSPGRVLVTSVMTSSLVAKQHSLSCLRGGIQWSLITHNWTMDGLIDFKFSHIILGYLAIDTKFGQSLKRYPLPFKYNHNHYKIDTTSINIFRFAGWGGWVEKVL